MHEPSREEILQYIYSKVSAGPSGKIMLEDIFKHPFNMLSHEIAMFHMALENDWTKVSEPLDEQSDKCINKIRMVV